MGLRHRQLVLTSAEIHLFSCQFHLSICNRCVFGVVNISVFLVSFFFFLIDFFLILIFETDMHKENIKKKTKHPKHEL